jgi:hypothetical protein
MFTLGGLRVSGECLSRREMRVSVSGELVVFKVFHHDWSDKTKDILEKVQKYILKIK